MAYTSFEVDQGELLERVEALCRWATVGGTFTDESAVPLADVDRAITDSYYWVFGELAQYGYATEQTATEVRKILSQIQALDAAIQIESSMVMDDTGEDSNRYRGLVARRDRMIRSFMKGGALEKLGASREEAKGKFLMATGVSRDRKADVRGDTDRIPPRFPRGVGRDPEAVDIGALDPASLGDR